jgi:hypothetical protein
MLWRSRVLATGMAMLVMGVAARSQVASRAWRQDALPERHIFLSGDAVRVRPPDSRGAVAWTCLDSDGNTVRAGTLPTNGEEIALGQLPVGWYRISITGGQGMETAFTTAAVLHRGRGPVRADSPICVDAATAWFARDSVAKQEAFSQLASLARINWIRDRMSWGGLEGKSGVFAGETTYDTSATAQAGAGLEVLQVFHSTPKWAITPDLEGKEAWKRFPRDLRHLARFCRHVAERYRGRVAAWEPWNEANIDGFGGHSIDEMCTMQKAAYLAFKAADPALTVCWNVFAGAPSEIQADIIQANETWEYFDTFNVHTYGKPRAYLSQFEQARRAASGRPLWLSECGIRLRWKTPRPWGELSPADEHSQARFVAKSYASSLYAGVDRHFFFILGNYVEREKQFGLLRHDLTPRPGYVALAAVGRFLEGGHCLGRMPLGDDGWAVLFRAFPDGVERDVVVVWAGESSQPAIPGALRSATWFDHLGRPVEDVPTEASDAPFFGLSAPGLAASLDLESPPVRGPRLAGSPSPIVLQAVFAAAATNLGAQAHRVTPGETNDVPVHVYNFGTERCIGKVSPAPLPDGWEAVLLPAAFSLAPGERGEATLSLTPSKGGAALLFGQRVSLRGDFGSAGKPNLVFRVIGDLTDLQPTRNQELSCSGDAAAWGDNITRDGVLTHRADGDGMRFDMTFAEADPWSYPELTLAPADRPTEQFDGLALSIQVHEGDGTLRVQFIEENGASYLADMGVSTSVRTPQQVVVLLRDAKWGSWSKPDPNRELDPERLTRILVGINAKRNSKVSMTVRDLRWVRFRD